jgi:hypothetical protein
MKTKWLDGLSEEGRSRLTEREKDFHLRYIVLTSAGDLEAIPPRPASPAPETLPEAHPVATLPAASSLDAVAVETAPTEPGGTGNGRKTLDQLTEAEEEEFRRRSGQG